MHFFLLLAIPSAAACILLTDSKYTFKQLSVPLFGGFLLGIVTALVREFFINSEHFPVAQFVPQMFHMAITTVTPALILTTLIYFFSKDDLDYKSYALFPTLAFFYTIVIPYQTFTQGEPESFFHAFLNPMYFIETILLFSAAARFATLAYERKDKKNMIIASLSAVACLFIEPAISVLWYMNACSILCGIIAVVLAPASVLVYKFSLK